MRRSTFVLLAAAMLIAGAAVRLNNVVVFPSLRGYDGFSHFTYIWFMAENWRVPLATSGWAFFHPPVYYALMAAFWDGLTPLDPVWRLKAGTAFVALLGLGHAAASYVIVRRYFPGDRLVHLLAPGLMLFVPVHLYSAGFLGNEALNAVLCSLAIVALLAVLRTPTTGRAALLGAALGLAMLTKFTSLAIVAGAFGTLALRLLVRREWRTDGRVVIVAATVLLMVAGWFYARNVYHYGTPFRMSRDSIMLQRVENLQTRGKRTLLEYVLFDPVVLYRPQWPRGLSIDGGRPSAASYSAIREAVPTGLYANTWFDGFGGWVLPPVTQSEAARRSGQILLTLALVPSLLVLFGIWTATRRLWRSGWDDTLVAMLLTFGAMVAIFVHGMRVVPMHAAVKATYMTPVAVVFSFWLALGFTRLGHAWPRARHGVAAVSAALAVACATVFAQGVLIEPDWLEEGTHTPPWLNAYGVVYYAGGDREQARTLFREAAEQNWHLAHENLAALALEEEQHLEALHRLRLAAHLQPKQTFGLTGDRNRFIRGTQAEYLNSMAVMYHHLGLLGAAVAAARKAVTYNPRVPEAHYDLALLRLTEALAVVDTAEDRWREALLARARLHLERAVALDPAFTDAWRLLATTAAMAGDCDQARDTLAQALAPPAAHRHYPIDTGPGDMHGAGIHRRRHIEPLPAALEPTAPIAACASAPHGA